MFKNNKKKLIALGLIGGALFFSSFGFKVAKFEKLPPPTNLKVLPKDISEDDLIEVMHTFNKALNYKCGDCHAKSSSNPEKLDFASEANPKKEIARDMMRMVAKINKKEFGIKGKFKENYLHNIYKVSCCTCHHGAETPEVKVPKDDKK